MNDFQSKLYRDLIKLCDTNEAFFHKDHIKDNRTYRIFNYRLASYGDFCSPNALECRGHMFEVIDDIPVRLASLPMEKFFNLYENPFTENVDLTKAIKVMAKEDGSLISTFIHNGNLSLKSKASLESDQAVDALRWLENNQPSLYDELLDLTLFGYTVNMEWTSPNNRIVLGYQEDKLIILNIRNTFTGEYVNPSKFHLYNEIHKCWVENVEDLKAGEIDLFVSNIPSMEDVEGFVVELSTGQKIKIKTEWYLVRHRAKDSVNAPRRLFEAIISEAIDDVRTLFHGDPVALQTISEMEARVEPIFNHMIETVERFYEENKGLIRKDYAIKAQGLNDGLMPLYMNLYIGRENDYKEFAIKNYKMFIGEVNDSE